MIRPAWPEDAAAIAEIWNPVIRDTAITFTNELNTPGGLARAIADRAGTGHGFLVADPPGMADKLAGYGPGARYMVRRLTA
jgi:phosphinothricin acetyltransferase